jgi:hypothetical protein
MATKKVLIITHTQDNECVELVSKQIKEAGGEAIRFDVDRYPLDSNLTTVYKDGKWQVLLDTGNGEMDLNDVTAVWFRRAYGLGSGLNKVLEKEYLQPSLLEVKRTLYGMLDGLNCFHLDHLYTYRRLDSKEEQLRKAVRHGLKIPATCISNDPQEVKQFIEQVEGSVVTKMQSSFAIYREKEEHVVFTNELTDDHLQDLDGLKYCPMVFQEKIEKKLELRITIVGRKIFAFSIDSQQIDNARVDWRKEGVALIDNWQPYQLPANIEKSLHAFMDDYNINYGAIDILVSPDDEYYFLEINSAGEFFWLDRLCDNAISKHLANVLLGNVPRREPNNTRSLETHSL